LISGVSFGADLIMDAISNLSDEAFLLDENSIQGATAAPISTPATPQPLTLSLSSSDSGYPGLVRRGSLSSLPFGVVKQLDKSNEARPPSPRAESPLRTSLDGLTRKASRDNILSSKKASSDKLDIASIIKSAPKETPDIKEDKI